MKIVVSVCERNRFSAFSQTHLFLYKAPCNSPAFLFIGLASGKNFQNSLQFVTVMSRCVCAYVCLMPLRVSRILAILGTFMPVSKVLRRHGITLVWMQWFVDARARISIMMRVHAIYLPCFSSPSGWI